MSHVYDLILSQCIPANAGNYLRVDTSITTTTPSFHSTFLVYIGFPLPSQPPY